MADVPKCVKKLKFQTRKEAKVFIKQSHVGHNHHFHSPLTVSYYCEQHSCWHVTSMPKQAARDFERSKKNKK